MGIELSAIHWLVAALDNYTMAKFGAKRKILVYTRTYQDTCYCGLTMRQCLWEQTRSSRKNWFDGILRPSAPMHVYKTYYTTQALAT